MNVEPDGGCGTNGGGVDKPDDLGPPPTTQQIAQQSAVNVFRGPSGSPMVRVLTATGSATYIAAPTDVQLVSYISAAYNPALNSGVISKMQSYLSSVDTSQTSGDDLIAVQNLIASARAAIAAVKDAPTLKAAFDSTNAVVLASQSGPPLIAHVVVTTTFYLDIGNGATLAATGPLPQDMFDQADIHAKQRARRALLRRIAAAALRRRGQVTSNLPGTANGGEACTKMVQLTLTDVFGHQFVAAHPNATADPVWVPDLVLGLKAAGWTAQTSLTGVGAGWIAVQNGSQDGGAPGSDNPFMNHVGVVVNSPVDGSLEILSNSSSNGSFTYMDSLQFPHIGYPASKMGPTLFLAPPLGD